MGQCSRMFPEGLSGHRGDPRGVLVTDFTESRVKRSDNQPDRNWLASPKPNTDRVRRRLVGVRRGGADAPRVNLAQRTQRDCEQPVCFRTSASGQLLHIRVAEDEKATVLD